MAVIDFTWLNSHTWHFIEFYWVLLGFTGFYWVLLGFNEFYWVLLGFTWFYRVLPSFTEFYWVLFQRAVQRPRPSVCCWLFAVDELDLSSDLERWGHQNNQRLKSKEKKEDETNKKNKDVVGSFRVAVANWTPEARPTDQWAFGKKTKSTKK